MAPWAARRGRIVDLSRVAFGLLADKRKSILNVKVEIL
jgi:rare lipoprotein A (peptidoglycan hydrolase)